jgi:hypothetical protein
MIKRELSDTPDGRWRNIQVDHACSRVSRSIGRVLFIAMSPQLWSTGWLKGATAFESATFPGFAHPSRNRVGLLFRQTQASEGIIH